METGRISEGSGGSPGLLSSGSDKGGIRSILSRESYSASTSRSPPRSALEALFFRSFFHGLNASATPCAGRAGTRIFRPRQDRLRTGFSAAHLRAENHRVHDPPRQEGEQAGNDQRAHENQDHDPAMIGDPMAPGSP